MGKIFKKGKLTPRYLRRHFGKLTNTNESVEELVVGAQRQWRRYNDPKFQEFELNETLKKMYPKYENE